MRATQFHDLIAKVAGMRLPIACCPAHRRLLLTISCVVAPGFDFDDFTLLTEHAAPDGCARREIKDVVLTEDPEPGWFSRPPRSSRR